MLCHWHAAQTRALWAYASVEMRCRQSSTIKLIFKIIKKLTALKISWRTFTAPKDRPMTLARFVTSIAVAAFAAFAAPVLAQDVPAVTITSASGSVTFDRTELEAMGLVSVKTKTPWNEGVVDFEGVPMTLLLEKAGAVGDTTTVIALNDYSVDIPTADFAEFGTILAVKRNGDYMPVDDQGPYFVIYPFDSNPVLQGQPYYGRAVWQVKEIEVE